MRPNDDRENRLQRFAIDAVQEIGEACPAACSCHPDSRSIDCIVGLHGREHGGEEIQVLLRTGLIIDPTCSERFQIDHDGRLLELGLQPVAIHSTTVTVGTAVAVKSEAKRIGSGSRVTRRQTHFEGRGLAVHRRFKLYDLSD